MPSFTRSGLPSFSFAARPPSGRTSTAFRASSAMPMRATLPSALALLRKRTRPRKRRRIRKLRLLALLGVLALLGMSAFAFGLLTSVSTQISELDPLPPAADAAEHGRLRERRPHGARRCSAGSQARVVVPSEDISPLVKQAIVAIEDKRFYEHRGVDVHGILRAVWSDLSGGPVEGGSTITQQFIKNAVNGNAPTLTRKLREAALAWKLEQVWSKDRILTAYLNTIYFGNSAYGVQEAAKIYFGHGANEPHARRGGAARRDSRGPEPLRPGRPPRRDARTARPRAAADVPSALHRRPGADRTP